MAGSDGQVPLQIDITCLASTLFKDRPAAVHLIPWKFPTSQARSIQPHGRGTPPSKLSNGVNISDPYD